jgi:hypothetical protein
LVLNFQVEKRAKDSKDGLKEEKPKETGKRKID